MGRLKKRDVLELVKSHKQICYVCKKLKWKQLSRSCALCCQIVEMLNVCLIHRWEVLGGWSSSRTQLFLICVVP